MQYKRYIISDTFLAILDAKLNLLDFKCRKIKIKLKTLKRIKKIKFKTSLRTCRRNVNLSCIKCHKTLYRCYYINALQENNYNLRF